MVLSNTAATRLCVSTAGMALATSFAITQTSYYDENRSLLAFAITCDLTLFLPLLYFFWARRNRVAMITVVPVFVLALAAASWLIPQAQQQYLDLIKLSLAPLEIFAVGYLVIKVRRVTQSYRLRKAGTPDFLAALHAALTEILGRPRAVEIITTEVCLFYYAFFSLRHAPEIPEAASAFTYHKKSAYAAVVAVFMLIILVETFALHLLIARFNTTAAWLLSGLSMYAVIFLWGDLNAARKRPIYFDGNDLVIRTGLRWRAIIPLAQIDSWERATRTRAHKESPRLESVLFGAPNLVIYLRRPLTARGFYGLKKEFEILALGIDDPASFEKTLRERVDEQSQNNQLH